MSLLSDNNVASRGCSGGVHASSVDFLWPSLQKQLTVGKAGESVLRPGLSMHCRVLRITWGCCVPPNARHAPRRWRPSQSLARWSEWGSNASYVIEPKGGKQASLHVCMIFLFGRRARGTASLYESGRCLAHATCIEDVRLTHNMST